MKKKSITFKLFIVTALFFILFTSITMLLQTLFIEKFYFDKKPKILKPISGPSLPLILIQ
ncbi:hypothetical protein N752_27220 [Desulforamulus aquiferis]|nr:hypothetical protein N752_27220 [Desulforamulus aquiferis]